MVSFLIKILFFSILFTIHFILTYFDYYYLLFKKTTMKIEHFSKCEK